MADYRDPEPLEPVEIDYDQSKVDTRVRNYADHVRHKIYGVDVREALARSCEIAALIAREAVDKANAMEESARRAEEAAQEAQADANRAETAANKAESIADNLEGLAGKATKAEAEAGIIDNKYMTPLRTHDAVKTRITGNIVNPADDKALSTQGAVKLKRRSLSQPDNNCLTWLRPISGGE